MKTTLIFKIKKPTEHFEETFKNIPVLHNFTLSWTKTLWILKYNWCQVNFDGFSEVIQNYLNAIGFNGEISDFDHKLVIPSLRKMDTDKIVKWDTVYFSFAKFELSVDNKNIPIVLYYQPGNDNQIIMIVWRVTNLRLALDFKLDKTQTTWEIVMFKLESKHIVDEE
jgi:hypothetical protein